MNPTNHTAEPWITKVTGSGIYSRCADIYDEAGDCIASMDSRGALAGPDEIIANAKRIVDCVNACQGILKPSAVKDVAEALREIATGTGRMGWCEGYDFAAMAIALSKKALAALTAKGAE